MEDRNPNSLKERFLIEMLIIDPRLIQIIHRVTLPPGVLLVKQRIHYDRQTRINHIIELIQETVEEDDPREERKPTVRQQSSLLEPILVETIVHQLTILTVPLPPVVQRQQFYKLELTSHIIRHPRSLRPLLPLNPNPHIRLLYHIHVVRPVAHRHRQMRCLLLHTPHDLLLVLRRTSVTNSRMKGNIRRDQLFSVQHEHLRLLAVCVLQHLHPPFTVVFLTVLRNVYSPHPRIYQPT